VYGMCSCWYNVVVRVDMDVGIGAEVGADVR
jgi:hypothetical protein